jgi:purine-nucleoside phosphorylase
MQPDVAIRDIVLAQACTSLTTPSKGIFRELNFAPCADFGLLMAAHKAATGQGARVHVGNIYSSDVFYDERPDLNEVMQRHKVLCVEMEAAELYMVAARFGVRALAVLTMSDHLLTHEALSASEREQSFGAMIEVALDAAFARQP